MEKINMTLVSYTHKNCFEMNQLSLNIISLIIKLQNKENTFTCEEIPDFLDIRIINHHRKKLVGVYQNQTLLFVRRHN